MEAIIMSSNAVHGSDEPLVKTVSIEESINLEAKPSAVWALLGDFNGMYRWHPAVKSSLLDGNNRILTLDNGARIKETLLNQNDAGSAYRYVITESPLPVKDYEACIQVRHNENGGSFVSWSCQFNADGVPDQDAEQLIREIYIAGLSNLSSLYN